MEDVAEESWGVGMPIRGVKCNARRDDGQLELPNSIRTSSLHHHLHSSIPPAHPF